VHAGSSSASKSSRILGSAALLSAILTQPTTAGPVISLRLPRTWCTRGNWFSVRAIRRIRTGAADTSPLPSTIHAISGPSIASRHRDWFWFEIGRSE
jgi:hypothetical protein